MSASPSPATWADYRAAVSRFLEALDRVLENGNAAQRRYEEFCRAHGIQIGGAEEKLTAETLPAPQRNLHARLLQLTQQLYDSELGPSAKPRPPLVTTANRALRSHNRI
ncbi:hypothetical protein DB347_06230 [Opitutaceae bacterium EW11]|nr:hypothetical protein DB347_06230 [Opitutaceae bacterium EW11]